MPSNPQTSAGSSEAWDEALAFIDAALNTTIHSPEKPSTSSPANGDSSYLPRSGKDDADEASASPTNSELVARQAQLDTVDISTSCAPTSLLTTFSQHRAAVSEAVHKEPRQSSRMSLAELRPPPLATPAGEAWSSVSSPRSPWPAHTLDSAADDDELRSTSAALRWPSSAPGPSLARVEDADEIGMCVAESQPSPASYHSEFRTVPGRAGSQRPMGGRLEVLSQRVSQQEEEIRTLRAQLMESASRAGSSRALGARLRAGSGVQLAASSPCAAQSLSPSTISASSPSQPSFFSPMQCSAAISDAKIAQGMVPSVRPDPSRGFQSAVPKASCPSTAPQGSGLAVMHAASARVGDLQAKTEMFWAQQRSATLLLDSALRVWLGFGGAAGAEEAKRRATERRQEGEGGLESWDEIRSQNPDNDEAFWAKVMFWQEAEISRLLADNARWRTHLKFQEAASSDSTTSAPEASELRILHQESLAQLELIEQLLSLPSPGPPAPFARDPPAAAVAAASRKLPGPWGVPADQALPTHARPPWRPTSPTSRRSPSQPSSPPASPRIHSPRMRRAESWSSAPREAETTERNLEVQPSADSSWEQLLEQPLSPLSAVSDHRASLRRFFLRGGLSLRSSSALAEVARRGPANIALSLLGNLRQLRLQGSVRHDASRQSAQAARLRAMTQQCSRLLQEKARLLCEMQEEESASASPKKGVPIRPVATLGPCQNVPLEAASCIPAASTMKEAPARPTPTLGAFKSVPVEVSTSAALSAADAALSAARAARGAGVLGTTSRLSPHEPCFDQYSLHGRTRMATSPSVGANLQDRSSRLSPQLSLIHI